MGSDTINPIGMSHQALSAEGVTGQLLTDAAMASVMADFSPSVKEAQSITSAHRHAMKMPSESDIDAYRRYENYVNSMINRCDAIGLGRAMHAVQDSAAGGHGFAVYNGSVSVGHLVKDKVPSANRTKEAIVKSQNVISRFREICQCRKY